MTTQLTPRAAASDPMVDVFIARQPIFDLNGNVVAYELLYRRTGSSTAAEGTTGKVMASEVLVQAFLNIGIDHVTGGAKAYLNFTREMLLERVYQLFDPSQVVIELLETVRPDEEVIAATRAMVEAGYVLALDDFEYEPAFEPLLDLAAIVKLDVLNRDERELRARVDRVKRFNVTVLAERVETVAVRDACRSMGFQLFQGYFFSRPETLVRRDLSSSQLTILDAMNLLQNPHTTDARLEEAFRGDVSLSYKLLRSVNSASSGGRGIASIRHAIGLIGRAELYKWLSLLLVTSVVNRGGGEAELVHLAIQRARMCEMVALQGRDRRTAERLFMVGLFSLLDAILKLPLADVLQRLDLADEVRRALIARSGPYAPTLSVVEAFERGAWAAVGAECEASGIDTTELGDIYVDALRWTRERTGTLARS